ncbi:unnamed protein product, partial [Mycena citricolor]
ATYMCSSWNEVQNRSKLRLKLQQRFIRVPLPDPRSPGGINGPSRRKRGRKAKAEQLVHAQVIDSLIIPMTCIVFPPRTACVPDYRIALVVQT